MGRWLIWGVLALLLLGTSCGQRRETPLPPAAASSSSTQEEPANSTLEEDTSAVEALSAIMTLTVPEGYTLARIGMELEDKGVCTVDQFLEAAQAGDFSDYPIVAAQIPNENRCWNLEGYLFPATYEIYATESPDSILRKLLDHTQQRITPALQEQIKESDYTVEEILTLASIIEKEAFGHSQMPGISSVLHNRLAVEMPLQCDVSINYVEGAIKPFLTGDIDRYNEYYNTYKCPALPAGPICNPSMDAILAALSPADTDYLYFVTDTDKNYYYAATWEEHTENLVTAGLPIR